MLCHARACLPLAVLGTLLSPLQADDLVEVEFKDLKLTVPASWKQEEPSNNLRLGQFQIGPAEGDKEAAELVISSFPGGGGGVDANLKRWIGEFSPEGRKVKLWQGTSSQGKYYLCDLTGTYNKRVGPPIAGKTTPVPGSRALEIILVIPEKNVYFLKLTGPEKTVTAAEQDFRKSIGANPDKAEPYELK
jgi:hypothetical protein